MSLVAAAILSVVLMGTPSAHASLRDGAPAPHEGAIRAPGADTCRTLAGFLVPMADIALPTRGAVVTSAELKPASVSAPEYCETKGYVLAFNPADPPIGFQLNLPTAWNGHAFQFGGAGLNGLVITGLGNVPHAPTGAPTPLAQGYVTFGDDSGHTGTPLTGEFGLNEQALANYGGESVKRSRDTAVAVMRQYYGVGPRLTYFAGGSKGGHEALVAAQRYGADYDGIIAYYPANQNQAMVISWFRLWKAAFRREGGSLSAAQLAEVQDEVLRRCDRLDGARDEIVSDLERCDQTFEPDLLRCEGEGDATCLSDLQLDTLTKGTRPLRFTRPLANGVRSIGPYPVFQGGDLSVWFDDTGTADKVSQAFLGSPTPVKPSLGGAATSYGIFTDQVIRYFIQQNPASTTLGFDYRDWLPRVEHLSRLLDATDPNLDSFAAGGGKLLLVQGSTDMLVPHQQTTAYYKRVRERYGAGLSDFLRYYIVPGFAHAGGDFNMTWDSVAAIERWVTQGEPPTDPVTRAGGRSRPLCEYPAWPRYRSRGDMDRASSFACMTTHG